MALNPGELLLNGQYRILRQIGHGGFGYVYQAEDRLLGGEVAIKELIPSLVGSEETLKRFLSEAKATMRLTHERIVRTYNVFSEKDNYYIVMEFMAGGSLDARLQQAGPLSVQEAVRVAAEVCEGLDYAHQRGVVHCDLKPANILFTADGQAKVADFGIAHVSERLVTRTWHTSAGFVAGTLPYMSPEQVDGVRDDPRIDIYALGAVLYRALTERSYLDFDQRETPGAQADNVYRLRGQHAVAPSGHNSLVPPWLDTIILKALSKVPVDRFASAADMRTALLQTRAQVPPSRAAVQPTPARRERPARRPGPAPTPPPEGTRELPGWLWPAVGGAAALIVVLGVAIAVILTGQGRGKETPTSTRMSAATETSVTFVTVVIPPERSTEPAPVPVMPTSASTPSPVPPTRTSRPTSVPPTATLTPALAGVDTDGLFFYEEYFDDPSSGWVTGPAGDAEISYIDGEYEIAIYQPDWVVWGNAGIEQDLFSVGVGVYASLVSGPLESGLGLLVRFQPTGQDFYQFQINGNGHYKVDMLLDGVWAGLGTWEASEAINQGLGAVNYLQVLCYAEMCSFYVNDVYLTELIDDTFASGDIGLFASAFNEGGVVVRFDDVIVLSLDE